LLLASLIARAPGCGPAEPERAPGTMARSRVTQTRRLLCRRAGFLVPGYRTLSSASRWLCFLA